MLDQYLTLPRTVRILCLGSLVNRAGSFVLVFLTLYASEQLGATFPTNRPCACFMSPSLDIGQRISGGGQG